MSPDISALTKKGKFSAIYDGQFGSTGKGLAGAWAGEHNDIDWVTTNASANAGHTSIVDGDKIVTFHIPNSFLTARKTGNPKIYINAGAIVDLEVLCNEIMSLGIHKSQIFVNPNAAIILSDDQKTEKDVSSSATKIASTQKGVGAALSRKISRTGPNLGQYVAKHHITPPFQLKALSLNQEMSHGKSVLMEVPQGFSLSLNNSGFYPYTTSRDCTIQQGMSDAGLHPSFFYKSMAVLRTYPIRVGNIHQGERQIGFSGHVYPDQTETSFVDLGVEAERTTVTQRVRRIFTFSPRQYEEMLLHNRPDYVLLNFANYAAKEKLQSISGMMSHIEKKLGMSLLTYYGYGPSSDEISEYIK